MSTDQTSDLPDLDLPSANGKPAADTRVDPVQLSVTARRQMEEALATLYAPMGVQMTVDKHLRYTAKQKERLDAQRRIDALQAEINQLRGHVKTLKKEEDQILREPATQYELFPVSIAQLTTAQPTTLPPADGDGAVASPPPDPARSTAPPAASDSRKPVLPPHSLPQLTEDEVAALGGGSAVTLHEHFGPEHFQLTAEQIEKNLGEMKLRPPGNPNTSKAPRLATMGNPIMIRGGEDGEDNLPHLCVMIKSWTRQSDGAAMSTATLRRLYTRDEWEGVPGRVIFMNFAAKQDANPKVPIDEIDPEGIVVENELWDEWFIGGADDEIVVEWVREPGKTDPNANEHGVFIRGVRTITIYKDDRDHILVRVAKGADGRVYVGHDYSVGSSGSSSGPSVHSKAFDDDDAAVRHVAEGAVKWLESQQRDSNLAQADRAARAMKGVLASPAMCSDAAAGTNAAQGKPSQSWHQFAASVIGMLGPDLHKMAHKPALKWWQDQHAAGRKPSQAFKDYKAGKGGDDSPAARAVHKLHTPPKKKVNRRR